MGIYLLRICLINEQLSETIYEVLNSECLSLLSVRDILIIKFAGLPCCCLSVRQSNDCYCCFDGSDFRR